MVLRCLDVLAFVLAMRELSHARSSLRVFRPSTGGRLDALTTRGGVGAEVLVGLVDQVVRRGACRCASALSWLMVRDL